MEYVGDILSLIFKNIKITQLFFTKIGSSPSVIDCCRPLLNIGLPNSPLNGFYYIN